MAVKNGNGSPGPPPGPGVDARGEPVVDPTKNVLQLVEAAIERQDDLRDSESQHIREIMQIRASYDSELRQKEADRLDAIRAVDVGAVQQAAAVSQQQAQQLATQVAASAEAMRNQVAAAATASATSLGAALDPIQKDIADLRRAQYEAQGQKTQVVESRGGVANWGTIIGIGVGILGVLALVITLIQSSGAPTP